ncbi:hypothetical protein KSP39_PZI018654 [Platanthera zijinensis]|uniref:Uncharacterized protein n=1 Tax=Platanthera zijinensis TaxID=2320716 RepID=A0AAP0FZ61_9ASPA
MNKGTHFPMYPTKVNILNWHNNIGNESEALSLENMEKNRNFPGFLFPTLPNGFTNSNDFLVFDRCHCFIHAPNSYGSRAEISEWALDGIISWRRERRGGDFIKFFLMNKAPALSREDFTAAAIA